jgi:hypothetical protein
MDISARDMKRPTEGPSDDGTDPAAMFNLIDVLSKCVHGIPQDLFNFQFVGLSILPGTLFPS